MLARIGELIFGSVRRQLIVGVAAAVILLTGAFVAYQVEWQKSFLLERQTEHAFGIARTLAGSSAGWVAARDAAGLQELVDAQRRHGKIDFAIVTDARGEVLAATDRRQVGRYLLDLPADAKEILFSDELSRVDVAAPVLVNDRLVGWVRVGFGEANIAEEMSYIRWSGLLFALVATAIATGFAAWLGRRLTKRLDILDSAMARIEAGEDQVPISLSGTDEAARLAAGFNRMLDALAEREQARQREEDALTAAIAYSRSLIEASPDPLVTISVEGKITDVNEATMQATGVSREALVGSDFSTYFTEPDKARAGYEEVFEKGFVKDYPLALRSASGKVMDVLYNASVYRDDKGEVKGVFAAARDITERKRAEEALDARVRQQAATAELGVHMLESRNLLQSLDEAAQMVASTLGVEFCEILECRSGQQALLLHYGVGWKEGLVGRATVEGGAGSQAGYTLQSATPVILDDLRNERRFRAPPLLLEHNVVSGITVVIPGRHGPFGVLGAHTTKQRIFSIDDINFLQAAANVISAAVEQIRASLYTRSLIEASLDPLVTISAEGKITDVNDATMQATGVSREALVGSDFSTYFTEPDKARAGYKEVFAKGFVRDYPLALRNVSGKVIDVLYNANIYRDENGDVAGVFAAARDVTELKRTEAELRKHRAHLEEMVAARTAELAEANSELESANKELETFAYSVSHDLRAPLRAIEGFSRILLEDYADKLGDEGRRVINVVCDSTAKMSQMIQDILSLSRSGRGEMKTASVDMKALVDETIKELEPATSGRNVKFEIGALPEAQVDAPLMRHVWTNLLDNAIKFTSHRAQAIIQVGAIPGESETIYYVRDNGAGFDMKYADKLFGAFQRLHGAEFAGNGIGLAIVKRIVVRHGGRIWAEAKPDEGATFYFSLPKSGERP
jgi:PAS domain S-box-containing protein